MRWHFDLSRNKSFRTLETTAQSISAAGNAAPGFLKAVLSTIPSHLPLDVVITYQDLDVGYFVNTWAKFVRVTKSPEPSAEDARCHQKRFRVLSEIFRVRKFRLVLCADVPDCIAKYANWVLEDIVEAERKNGGLGYLACGPSIVTETWVPRVHSRGYRVGEAGNRAIYASAL